MQDPFEIIDIDKILRPFLWRWWDPFDSWFFGLLHEESFLHDLVRHNRLHENSWDVGTVRPIHMTYAFALLHQKALNKTDRFGADFALTISFRDKVSWTKTALFQSKIGSSHSVSIDKEQLLDALAIPEFANRSFVLALDDTRRTLRLESVANLASQFPSTKPQKTKTFYSASWLPSSTWLIEWLRCKHGDRSGGAQPHNIENLLSAYVVEPVGSSPLFQSSREKRLPDGFRPAKAWAVISLDNKRE